MRRTRQAGHTGQEGHTGQAKGDTRRLVSTRRLEAFTDGVFAIAATLLVLELSTESLDKVRSDDAMWHALFGLWPSVLNFAVSFVLLAILWMVHLRQFEYISRVDTVMLWLNSLRLLGVVFVPFATSLNDDFNGYLAGRIVLPITFLWVVVLGAVQWFYASTSSRYLAEGIPADVIQEGRAGGIAVVVLAVGVVLLSTVVGSLAFFLYALNPFVTALAKRLPWSRSTEA